MKNNKSPGSDGFTAEFFKFFWNDIGVFIVRSLNEGYRKGEFTSTQKLGIITCIPKGDKNREQLQNWRPISLLNVVYKIASGCIAERMKNVLDKLISENQTGFIKGRYIGENIRLIYDLLNYTDTHDIPGMLFLIDFQKAYDTDIKGIVINGEEYKHSQFADDATLILDGTFESLNTSLILLKTFAIYSGLNINLSKCKCI